MWMNSGTSGFGDNKILEFVQSDRFELVLSLIYCRDKQRKIEFAIQTVFVRFFLSQFLVRYYFNTFKNDWNFSIDLRNCIKYERSIEWHSQKCTEFVQSTRSHVSHVHENRLQLDLMDFFFSLSQTDGFLWWQMKLKNFASYQTKSSRTFLWALRMACMQKISFDFLCVFLFMIELKCALDLIAV